MKAYVKPELFYERYELSQHIADCGLEFKNNTDVMACYAVADPKFNLGYGDAHLFSTACETQFEGYCYMDGPDGIRTFVS